MNIIIRKIKFILLSISLLVFIFNMDIVITSTKECSLLFFNKIFISIFPFIILSDILIYYDYHIFLKNTIGKYISKLFNIDANASIIFILSILTSSPSNSIYIQSMLDNNEIDLSTANKVLCYTYFPSISFVIGTIGYTLYKSFKIGVVIYILCIIYNLIIAIILRGKNKIYKNNTYNKSKEQNSLFQMLSFSIKKAINACFIILGMLIIFTIIINLINKYIYINDNLSSVVSGILEMTNGIIKINNLNIDLKIKIILTSFILNFSGLSIIFQSMSILSKYKINIKKIIMTKFITSLIITIILITFLK